MSSYISFRKINASTCAQNAGVFIGDVTIPGLDSNQKINSAHAAIYGYSNYEASTINLTIDSHEIVDGTMNDQDSKDLWSQNS